MDMTQVTEILGKVVEWVKGVDWEAVFATVKDVVTKIVEFVSGLAA